MVWLCVTVVPGERGRREGASSRQVYFSPYQAPCEAEAQCAAMVKAGKVFATATEDMDSLTFGSNVLLHHLTISSRIL